VGAFPFVSPKVKNQKKEVLFAYFFGDRGASVNEVAGPKIV